ncbi:hypothetical protein QNE43_003816 [Vibrio vulnificus]|uniref:hypothetical protein n=1 Tax=Vibrio vulnificus TaxID=672 RepID=UPI001CDCFB30|nr:hypothetical protein [Vibrio vulnificus]ELV8657110.1 hypothetical protein [Vibrio vulnificus]MCA3975755.1 hypothetical protein [Vibrio vulnificus]MCA4002640.1 hypothetical protein [Vibrio vulnificus]
MNAANDSYNRQSKLKKLVYTIKWVGLVTFPLIGYAIGDDLKASAQKDIVSFLLTISAIIFGVIGVWLSILKVELQHGIANAASNEQANEYMTRARGLIEPITSSSAVLLGALFFLLFYYILPSYELSDECINLLKQVSFGFVMLGAYLIIYSVILIIYFGADFLLGLSDENQKARAKRQRTHYKP